MLKSILNTLGALNAGVNAYKVKTGVDSTSGSSSSDDSESAQHQRGTTSDRLSASRRLLPGVGALASIRWTTTSAGIGSLADVWVLIWVLSKVESQVINHISLLHNIRAFSQISLRSLRTNILKLSKEIRVRGGTQAGKHAELTEEEGGGADGEDCALTAWVFLLDVGKGLEDAEGLGLLLDNGLEVAAGDDEDVEGGEGLLQVGVGAVGFEEDAVGGFDGWRAGGEDAFEGFGLCGVELAGV